LKPEGGLGCGSPAVRDTVWYADAAEAAAGEEQAGMAGEPAFDRCHTVEMADFMLRVAALPSIHAREERIALDAEQRAQRGQ